MKKIYLFIPALFLSLGLLAQTPAPEVQKVDSLRTDTVKVEKMVTAGIEFIFPEGGGIVDTNRFFSNAFLDLSPTKVSFWERVKKGEIFLKAQTTYTTPGPFSGTVPNTDFLIVETYGGGGGGLDADGSQRRTPGGGGGAYARSVFIVCEEGCELTPGMNYSGFVGRGGNNGYDLGEDGGDSSFSSGEKNVLAAGGKGASKSPLTPGSGGSASNSVGKNTLSGGNGANGGGTWSWTHYSGGGGGGAGPFGPGAPADESTGGEGGEGNPGEPFQGDGGDGGQRRLIIVGQDGEPGSGYGGGGGGSVYGLWVPRYGGKGGDGAVIITYGEEEDYFPCDISVDDIVAATFGEGGGSIIPIPDGPISYFDIYCEDPKGIILKSEANCEGCVSSEFSFNWVFSVPNSMQVAGSSYEFTVTENLYEGRIIVQGKDDQGFCFDNRRFVIRKSPGPEIMLEEPEDGEEFEPIIPGEDYSISVKIKAAPDEENEELIGVYLPFLGGPNPPVITKIEWDWDEALVDNWDDDGNGDGIITINENYIGGTLGILTVEDSFGCISTYDFPGDDIPLPIELLSFSATYREPEVVLEWATGSEINNDYFTLERSLDVEQAEIIGYVDGAGNSSQTLWYRFVDHNPLPGISYYRLKQTDFDGKFEYFDWVAVDAGAGEGDGLKVLVETHPQGHNLRIFSPGGGRLQVGVTDLLGRSVVNEQLSPAGQGQVEVFIPASASRQSVLIYRVTDGLEVVAGKIVR